MSNADRIKQIREETRVSGGAPNDAEALARLFTDSKITDAAATVDARLQSILDATELIFLGVRLIPGLAVGIEFSDEGFKGDQRHHGAGFRDPWPSSRNQVGHFLTVVGYSYNPATVERVTLQQTVRSWMGAPTSMSNEEVALRLIVGGEKKPDPDIAGTLLKVAIAAAVANIKTLPPVITPAVAPLVAMLVSGIVEPFKRQFQAATDANLAAFRDAERALGSTATLDMNAADPYLKGILRGVDVEHQAGNSLQDLRLSLAGWRLGQWIKQGHFSSRSEIADWVRVNLKA